MMMVIMRMMVVVVVVVIMMMMMMMSIKIYRYAHSYKGHEPQLFILFSVFFSVKWSSGSNIIFFSSFLLRHNLNIHISLILLLLDIDECNI